MYERVRFALPIWALPRAGALFRYELLDRLRRCGARYGVTLLAFGFAGASELRCVLKGSRRSISATLKAARVGTALALRHRGIRGGLGVGDRVAEPRAVDAVVWAHRAPLQGRRAPRHPLGTPWSSHRDLLGYREAVFFDAKPLRRSVDPVDVHRRCGGGATGPAAPSVGERWALATLLRVSAAVIGVVPADRRCFGVFVHLARAAGWSTREVAHAICLTPRRVRQLAASAPPHLELARRTLADPALQRVP